MTSLTHVSQVLRVATPLKQLCCLTEALRSAKALVQSSVLILLDLSAAFDTVNQNILISALSAMSISDNALLWFKDTWLPLTASPQGCPKALC